MGIRDWLAGIAASMSDEEAEEYDENDIRRVFTQEQIRAMYQIQALSGETLVSQIRTAVDHYINSKAFLLRNYPDYYPTYQTGMRNLQARMAALDRLHEIEEKEKENKDDEDCN